MSDRFVWWGTCEKCLTTLTVSPHPEREPLPDLDEWEDEMPNCPVCGTSVMMEGSDPVEGFRL